MFNQILAPVAGNLLLSFLCAALPIAVVLIALGVLRRPAWQASLAGLIVGLIVSILVWRFPPALAFDSVAAGATFGLWPVMWIVFNALLLYNIAVVSAASTRFATGCSIICRMIVVWWWSSSASASAV
jgi:lactate permease